MFAALKRWWYRRSLRSDAVGVRCDGIQGLARLKDRRDLPDLLALLIAPDAAVRQAAEKALSEIDPSWPSTAVNSDLLRQIVRVAVADDSGAESAGTLLGRIAHPDTVTILLELPSEQDHTRRIEAALERTNPNWPALELARRALRTFLSAPTSPIPFWVCRVVQTWQGHDQVSIVLSAAQLGHQRGVFSLWQAARRTALRSVPEHRDDWLSVLADQNRQPYLRELAADALGTLPEPRSPAVTQALLQALAVTDRFLRYAVIAALTRGKDRSAVPALSAALQELMKKRQDPIGRELLALALSESGDEVTVPLLLQLVEQDDWNLARIAAVKAVRRLLGERSAEKLIPLLTKSNAGPLYAYCYDLITANPDRFSPKVRADARMAHDTWTSDQKAGIHRSHLLSDIREVFKSERILNTVARMASVRHRLLEAGIELDEFVEEVRWKVGQSEARELADAWGVGGFWNGR